MNTNIKLIFAIFLGIILVAKEWFPISYEFVVILAATILFITAKNRLSQPVAELLAAESNSAKAELNSALTAFQVNSQITTNFRQIQITNELELPQIVVLDNNLPDGAVETTSLNLENILENMHIGAAKQIKSLSALDVEDVEDFEDVEDVEII